MDACFLSTMGSAIGTRGLGDGSLWSVILCGHFKTDLQLALTLANIVWAYGQWCLRPFWRIPISLWSIPPCGRCLSRQHYCLCKPKSRECVLLCAGFLSSAPCWGHRGNISSAFPDLRLSMLSWMHSPHQTHCTVFCLLWKCCKSPVQKSLC